MKLAVKPPRVVLEITRLSPTARRQRREYRRELAAIPKPVPWSWAEPRVLPILAGPRFDAPGEPLVRATSDLGPAVEFGLPIGPWFARVDWPVAERWECSATQLLDQAMSNLRDRAATLTPAAVRTGVLSGRQVRLLDEDPRWASSLVLDVEALRRVFGGHDQLIAAPRVDCLLSMPAETPGPVFAEIAIDLERETDSLWLDPFVLIDGVLTWANGDEDLDDDGS